MKKRLVKKKSHQTVGTCWRCGSPVLNFVTRPDYSGSCLECDEDMYRFEIHGYRRHGTPLDISRIPMRLYPYLPKW